MAITVTCSCGKRLRANDATAGRQARCPACGESIDIPSLQALADPELPPEPSPVQADTYKIADEPAPRPVTVPTPAAASKVESVRRPGPRRSSRPRAAAYAGDTPGPWHWLLVLALIPLAVSLLHREQNEEFEDRLKQTLEQCSEDEQVRI